MDEKKQSTEKPEDLSKPQSPAEKANRLQQKSEAFMQQMRQVKSKEIDIELEISIWEAWKKGIIADIEDPAVLARIRESQFHVTGGPCYGDLDVYLEAYKERLASKVAHAGSYYTLAWTQMREDYCGTGIKIHAVVQHPPRKPGRLRRPRTSEEIARWNPIEPEPVEEAPVEENQVEPFVVPLRGQTAELSVRMKE